MPLIRLHDLIKTIQKKLNISEKEARGYAEIIMDMFGYDDCILDNNLDHADRRLFYRLEAEGILSTRRDEAILSDGSNWRIRYWVFEKNILFSSEIKKKVKLARMKKKHPVKTIPPYDPNALYSSLPETAWTTRKNPFI
jgi:hypothetical protein